MVSAMEEAERGMPVKRAARMFGVPRSTLRDRVAENVKHCTNPGPVPYLTNAEEAELAGFLVDVAKAGYGKSRRDIKWIAESVAREKNVLKHTKISDGWYRRFMERQSHLSLRKGDPTANVRMDCLTPEKMKQYFELLKDVLEEHNLMESPGQIYNVDETGMPLDHRPPKVVTLRGQKKVRCRTSGNKSQITVIGCVSASGQAIPPFVIFDCKRLNKQWTYGEVNGTTYGMSAKGWVDSELFHGWLTDHFLQFAVAARPLLLVLDGHSSHYQPELVQYAKEKDVIILFCLPPHTTHESQPLDISVFKQNWQNACHKFMQSNPGKVVTKYQFSPLLNEAWMATMTPANICSGFRKCGIYPFNPDAIDCTISTENPAGNVQGGAGDEMNEDEGGECSHSAEDSGTFSAEKEQLFQMRYEEGYDLFDEEYLQWLNTYHPNAIPQDPEAPEAPPDLFDFDSADDLQLLANNSSLEDCLMPLDRMLGIEGEDGNGEETDFQIGGKGNSDHQQNSFDATSAVDSIGSGSLTSAAPLRTLPLDHPPLLALPHHPAPLALDHLPLLALPHHPAPLALADHSPLLALAHLDHQINYQVLVS